MTERDITLEVLQRAGFPPGVVNYNRFAWSPHFESDCILHSSSGDLYEFEFKNNYPDFKLDFTKCIGRMTGGPSTRRTRKPGDTRIFKHDLLKTGKTPLKQFIFCCPAGVIPASKVPDPCGLMYLHEDLFGFVEMEIVKRPLDLRGCDVRQPLLGLA